MSDKKQSSVDFILNAFNLLSDSDFKSWMLNNYDKIKSMHKEEIIESYCQGCLDMTNDDTIFPRETSEQYYNETFGGQDE